MSTNLPLAMPADPQNAELPATAGTSGRFTVRIINAGRSLNNNVYPEAVLRAAVPLFEGVRVFVKSDAEHLTNGGKDVRNLIGRIVDPTFVTATASRPAGIDGVLEPLDPADPVIRRMATAVQHGMTGLFGLSIIALVESQRKGRDRVAGRFVEVTAVDVVVDPAAGGAVTGLTEAFKGTSMNILSPAEIGRRIERTALSTFSKDRLIHDLEAAEEVTEARLAEAIGEATAQETEIAHALGDERGKVTGLGMGTRHARVIESQADKHAGMLDAFFNPADRSVRSIRECYVAITGDRDVTGRAPRHVRLSEALDSTSFPDALGDAVQRRMLTEYRQMGIYDVWRDLANIVTVGDFRDQHRVRYGGYSDMPIVNEAAPYLPVDSPTDEEAVYRVQKRGGTESVTLEMIKNDDVTAVQRVPIRLSRAAKRTLSKFVLDFLRTNGAIYDGVALFHASHGNTGTAALSASAIAAARLAMKAQKEKDSEEALGIPPRFLWVPDALEQAAFDLFRLGTNTESNFVQSLQWQIRPVWYWTDTSDWCLSADKADIPSVEVGFLDGNEEPELFIQDNPSAGSLFTNDVITYKLRHVYGGAVTDFRGLYKSVVP